MMRKPIKFLHYGSFLYEEIKVEWVRSLPDYLERDAIVIDAGYEADNREIQTGILMAD